VTEKTKEDLELELVKMRGYFIGVLTSLQCDVKYGVDASEKIERIIKELEGKE
jgi:hypothetical protein